MAHLIDSCLLCQSMLFRSGYLCRACGQRLLHGDLIHRYDRGLDIFSLLHYVPPAMDFIKMCKRESFAGLAQELGRILARKISYELLETVSGVIPMPAREFGRPDHAYRIAEAVSGQLSAPITAHFLERATLESQKEKTEFERSRLKIRRREDFPLSALGQSGIWLLVDDVITTGATVHAAWLALGRPPAVVLTLASTPRHQLHFIAS